MSSPLAAEHRRTVEAAHGRLRGMILSGELRPGATVSQAALARELGTSRTPLREAFRRLQEEGLLVVEPNRRAQVAIPDPVELDELYARRILLESLAVRMGTPTAPAGQRRRAVERSLAALARATRRRDAASWEASHRAFHQAVSAGATSALAGTLESLRARSERVVRARRDLGESGWELGQADHEAIGRAVLAGDADGAVRELAWHLARTATWTIQVIGNGCRPVAVDAALALLGLGGDDG